MPTIRIGRYIKKWTVTVVHKLVQGIGIILGEDFLSREKVIIDYPDNSAFIKSQGIKTFPIEKGDVHTRFHGISMNLMSSRPHAVDLTEKDILTPNQAVKALRKGHQHIVINVRECGSVSTQKQSALSTLDPRVSDQFPQGGNPASQECPSKAPTGSGPEMEAPYDESRRYIDLGLSVPDKHPKQAEHAEKVWPHKSVNSVDTSILHVL
jgi:hypothetical protein